MLVRSTLSYFNGTAISKSTLDVQCRKKNKKKNKFKGEVPRRLTPDTVKQLGGLKRAIRLVKEMESLEEGRQDRPMPTKFRKKKKTPEEIAAAKEKLRQEEIKNSPAHLRNLYGTDSSEHPPIIVVDGYNVIHEMAKQNPRRFKDKDLGEQRDILFSDVLTLSSKRGVRACIVYDAMGSAFPGSRTSSSQLGVDIVFCKSYEADFGLREESEKYLEEGSPSVTVVTSDNEAKADCFNPPFIQCQSSKLFVKELKLCKRETERKIDVSNATQPKNRLSDWLSMDTLSQLQEYREELLTEN